MTAGGGVGGNTTPVGGAGGSSATGGPVVCGTLIDDMEAVTGRICQGDGRIGHWFTYVDSDLSSSTISPSPGKVALPELLPTARETSRYAMHAKGRFYSYAGIGCLLNSSLEDGTHATFDASGYTGIRFYAKGSGRLKVTAQMPSTESVEQGGTCTAVECTPNSYIRSGNLLTSWTLITAPFYAFKDGLEPLDPSKLWSLEFQPYTEGPFDFWIDDLTFY